MLSLKTLIFNGMTPISIDVQVQLTGGLPPRNQDPFTIVGLVDKAVNESKERIKNALFSMNMSLPPQKITVNLAPSDIEKSGSYFDLPILCGILCELGTLPSDELSKYIVLGEIGLDGSVLKSSSVLPASVYAAKNNLGIICPAANGVEARWAGHSKILAPNHILELINHFRGKQILPVPRIEGTGNSSPLRDMDFSEVRGQVVAKRAMEIAAAGGHALLMVGPPGAGKTMLASRLPSILPDMTANEILETSMLYSIAGKLENKGLVSTRPFRPVHHSASAVALAGGGTNARPGEISLAHNGVLFLDELPEFNRQTLEILRQPIEAGNILISRAKQTISYPARFQLIAAMNPCPCGHLKNPKLACSKAPRCAEAYQNKISGPLLDRIDLHIEVDALNPWEMSEDMKSPESSATIRERVVAARKKQTERSGRLFKHEILNAHLDGKFLDAVAPLDDESLGLLNSAAEKMGLSARGYNRIKRIARTIADLRGASNINISDISEALSYRPINRGKI
ncbi:MAG: YifB family Mg chelatase-like AAA ATPase [Rickettsiales bacterium]|jgi:magnesium chelatase family protein|nr:YifB family Mg chelatase-like AAA ATPase [Rickettsiales bacterium]